MKYCKKCHVIYSGFAAACPKCGIPAQQKQEPPPSEGAGRAARDWLWLLIGIPAFIAAMYLIVRLIAGQG